MRGFAFTAHCPRCETAHPTGAEVTPIITCRSCGLGFDPKPREPQPREQPESVALVRTEAQIVEQVTNADVHLVIRDSVFTGIWLLLVAFALVFLGYLALGVKEWAYVVVAAGLAPAAAYGGISRLFGRTYVYVNHELISVWQEPLPRFRERFVGGDVETLSIAPHRNHSVDVIAKEMTEGHSLRLVNVSDEELATELVAAIRKHRARLGAPIRDEVKDQADARVERRDT